MCFLLVSTNMQKSISTRQAEILVKLNSWHHKSHFKNDSKIMFWYLLLNFQVFLLIDGWRRTFHFIYFKMDIHSVWMNVKCEHSLYSVHWVCNCYWKFRPISISYYLVFIRFNMDVHYSFGSFMPNFQLATISCRIWCLKAKIPGVLN
jgi:hypothetical protein